VLCPLPRTRTVSLLLLLAAGTLGCGDDALIITATSDTTSATTVTDPSTTSAESTSTASTPGSSGSSTETESATNGTSTSGTSTSGTSTSDTGATDTSATDTGATDTSATDTDGIEDAEYAARFFTGGLNRILIHKAENTGDLCTRVSLVFPEIINDDYTIATPKGWSVENIEIAKGAAECLNLENFPPLSVVSHAAAGTISWMAQEPCPELLDIGVTAEFTAGDLPWVPTKDQLFAEALAIEGCP